MSDLHPNRKFSFRWVSGLLPLILPAFGKTGTRTPMITVRIIGDETQGYCYELWQEGKRIFRQENLPVLPGDVRCKDAASARRIGQLAAQRISEGHLPRSLKQEEIEALLQAP